MAVLKADHVSIRYVTDDLRNAGLGETLKRIVLRQQHGTEFWANKDISFTLDTGDMLGIIGTNGAGKSTLLKAVSGIIKPTEGSITANGRVAALLELGSGFDGNLTVRENTFLRGALMGYPKQFMKDKYDEIIAFAELEDFQQHAFKNLSSGMKSRLAFSIACLVKPEVLILDEVLSVGDGGFKAKSHEKIRSILDNGVTGLLVSHSIGQVRDLCNKILWLDHGKQIIFSDDVTLCCDAYMEFLKTGILPTSEEELREMAASYQRRVRRKKRIERKKKEKKIRRSLDAHGEKYYEQALSIVRQYHPEVLADEYLDEDEDDAEDEACEYDEEKEEE